MNRLIGVLVVLLLMLSAAPALAQNETAQQNATAAPTETAVPTETATATETATPTETAQQNATAAPTETAVPTETATQTETATATETATPTETATQNETADEQLPDPGTTPDSALYFIDLAMDNLALALTFNEDAKIEKKLEIAEERLSEAKAMAEKGDANSMKKASDEHGKILSKLKDDISDIDDDDAENELEREIELEEKINHHYTKIKGVQDGLKINIKVEGNITAEQQELIDSVLASLEGQTGEVKIEIKNEKTKTKIKIEQKTGKNGDEVEDEIKHGLGITEKQKRSAQKEINSTRSDLDKVLAKYSRMNKTAPEDVVDEINDVLAQAQAAYNAGDYEEAKELTEQADDLVEDLEDGLKKVEESKGKHEDDDDDDDEDEDDDDGHDDDDDEDEDEDD